MEKNFGRRQGIAGCPMALCDFQSEVFGQCIEIVIVQIEHYAAGKFHRAQFRISHPANTRPISRFSRAKSNFELCATRTASPAKSSHASAISANFGAPLSIGSEIPVRAAIKRGNGTPGSIKL